LGHRSRVFSVTLRSVTGVTLRGVRMYEFLDRFVTIALPRVRDFRGISGRAFDGRGNYNVGVKEQIIFPEIDYDKIERIAGSLSRRPASSSLRARMLAWAYVAPSGVRIS